MEPWVDTVISELRQELVLPYLSLARIEKAFYTLLIQKITTSQIASIITGRNARKRADLSYTSQNQIKIYEAYQQAIEFLNQRSCLDLGYFKTKLDGDFRIGSQNTPEYSLVQQFFEHLHKQLITQTHYIDKFNAYSFQQVGEAHNRWILGKSFVYCLDSSVTDMFRGFKVRLAEAQVYNVYAFCF
mgnify:CR=1 FL=1